MEKAPRKSGPIYYNYDADVLTKQQKLGLVFLFLFTFGLVFFWYFWLRENLVRPLYGGLMPDELISEPDNKALRDFTATLLEQSDMDTDGDTLNDFVETNIYGTSPYLEDTDGDGQSDFEELQAKQDPLCPVGQTCTAGVPALQPAGQPGEPAEIDPFADLRINEEQENMLEKVFGPNPDIGFLREQLHQAAQNEEEKAMIDSLSDDQLKALFYKLTK